MTHIRHSTRAILETLEEDITRMESNEVISSEQKTELLDYIEDLHHQLKTVYEAVPEENGGMDLGHGRYEVHLERNDALKRNDGRTYHILLFADECAVVQNREDWSITTIDYKSLVKDLKNGVIEKKPE